MLPSLIAETVFGPMGSTARKYSEVRSFSLAQRAASTALSKTYRPTVMPRASSSSSNFAYVDTPLMAFSKPAAFSSCWRSSHI